MKVSKTRLQHLLTVSAATLLKVGKEIQIEIPKKHKRC